MDFTKITNFYGYILQYITLALMVYVTIVTVSTLVKEETDGTIEFLYSKPVSRNMIFLQKSFANISSFIVLLFVLSVVTSILDKFILIIFLYILPLKIYGSR